MNALSIKQATIRGVMGLCVFMGASVGGLAAQYLARKPTSLAAFWQAEWPYALCVGLPILLFGQFLMKRLRSRRNV